MLRTAISHLARRPWLAGLLLFLAGIAATALPTLRYDPPEPVLHDEHVYIFQAQTYAEGRLTNDPPPGPPELYDTFHEFITPRYYGKFPPAQSVALAAGILLGHPVFGVWLVMGLWAVALYWMLRAVAGPGWALGGALAGMAGYGALSTWGQTYWGGQVFALGGTLAFGGALRVWRRRGRPGMAAAWAGVGCAIMALTRPFDGFFFALLPAATILMCCLRGRRWLTLAAFVVPAFAGIGLLLGYNAATTGSPWVFAHRLYDETKLPGFALFVWDKPAPDPAGTPAYLVDYEKLFNQGLDGADGSFNWATYFQNLGGFAARQFLFLIPWWMLPLAIAGVVGAWAWRDRVARLALASLLFILLPLVMLRFYQFSHYVAAWTAPALILAVRGGRHWQQAAPRWLRLASCVAVAGLVAWPVAQFYIQMARGVPYWMTSWAVDQWNVEALLTKRAHDTGHPQLVAVVYPPDHLAHYEWVYNSPDPLQQDVLWVHKPATEKMGELRQLFPQYEIWVAYTRPDGRLEHMDKVELPPPDGATKD